MTAFSQPPAVAARVAGVADHERVTEIMVTSFFDDPTWGPLFGDGDRRRRATAAIFGFMCRSATRYPWVLMSEGGESAAVWIPPGGEEFEASGVEPFEQLIREQLGAGSDQVMEAFHAFELAQPSAPHFYLSLLGTHDDSRGRGIGLGLLAENLRRIDALGMPAYLESTNPANNERYARHGFVPHGSFTVPTGALVTTMWREPRGAAAAPADASPT